MLTVEKIISELKIGGYLDAAAYVEQLSSGTLNRTVELQYMAMFAFDCDAESDVYRRQLRSLWTAYCIHHDLAVDTSEYDKDIAYIWLKITEAGKVEQWYTVEDFESFMCENLV